MRNPGMDVPPVEHWCDGTDKWELGVSCDACPGRESKASALPAPYFNISRLKAWNSYQGAGGMTTNEYVSQMMEENRAAGKKPEEMPVPKTRWI